MRSGFSNIQEAEMRVQNIFHDEFPNDNFHIWNTEIHDSSASNIINNVGKADSIDVKQFIKDLWQ